MTSTTQHQRLLDAFRVLTDALVDDFDILNFLGLLTERASEVLDGAAAGVILADKRGAWHPAAASSESAALVELLAAQTAEGPCLDSVQTRQPVTSADLNADRPRWPTFTDQALRTGYRAAAALPLRSAEQVIGSLSLLSSRAHGLDETCLTLGHTLADLATVGLQQQRVVRREETLDERLPAVRHHRTVLEQAKGVLVERGDLSTQAAFEHLRDYSRSNGAPLSELGRDLANGTVDADHLLVQLPESGSGEGS